jgi:hypothetical protein
MNPSDASAELLLRIRHDRDAIEGELESRAAGVVVSLSRLQDKGD